MSGLLGITDRIAWLGLECDRLKERIHEKYIDGQISHGCIDLGTVSVDKLLDEIENEAMDTLMYVAEIRRQRKLEQAKQNE